jgi:diaminopimelate epimerase
MNIHFHKYQGTGNDFIIIDNRTSKITLSATEIALMCNRRFGIGADGLMLLENLDGFDFRMVYFNSDGKESTMCGNGGRCITAFAHNQKIIDKTSMFLAIDSAHNAEILGDETICLQMIDVTNIQFLEDHTILNTGSPHFVKFMENIEQIDVVTEGRTIRTQEIFMPDGINVNFVACMDEGLFIRTYERGVEDETLSCGTGVTAAAIASTMQETGAFSVVIKTLGGNLRVTFEKETPCTAKNVFLIGPALKVFEGVFIL